MDITQIIATLNHGKFFNRKIIAFFFFALALGQLMLLMALVMAILISAINELAWDAEMVIVIAFFFLFGLLLGGTALCVILKNRKQNKEIVLCLYDAIPLRALVKRLDIVSLNYKPYQIQVEFEFEGEKKYKISAPGSFCGGHHKIFAKFDNRIINILYSPKQDQVLILKQEN